MPITERGSLALLALLVPSLAVAQISGSTTNYKDTDCHGLKLIAASGVPDGSQHRYRFQGFCKLIEGTHTTDKAAGITYNTDNSSKVIASQWTTAEASWDAPSGEFSERVTTEGQHGGTIEMVLYCKRDPVITSGKCDQRSYENHTGWSGFDGAWNQHRPVTRGKTTLAEATAVTLHTQTWPKPANQPPPPASGGGGSGGPSGQPGPGGAGGQAAKTMSSPSGMTVIEGEQLIAGAQVTHGQIARQNMRTFGRRWSGDEQLFWSVTVPGAQLQLKPTVARAGRYEVFVAFTMGPDFGLFKASFDGHAEVTINGYAATVGRGQALVGMFDLAAGQHELLLSVVGRDPKSTALFVGIDRIELKPVP